MSLTLLALMLEAAFGYPPPLLARVGHPVIWIGAAIDALDKALNHGPPLTRRLRGALALALLLAPCFTIGFWLQRALLALPFGVVPLALLASTLLAQRGLHEHVANVLHALEKSLDEGRAAVGKIVGRDVTKLDEAGVARAAIESLAENFSDGIVAPALWLAVFGLPGALCYKAINTADSMIGHKNKKYQDFGFAAARLDDLVNLPASRLSAALLIAAAATQKRASASEAARIVSRDARTHASPNAGWPEAAMAGALDLKLGGERAYGDRVVAGATLGDGRSGATPDDMRRALNLYRAAAAGLWLLAGVGWVFWGA
ncbi:MAG: adenosylcobinamide-phosphate synthase CbiB [Methylocystis sp.]